MASTPIGYVLVPTNLRINHVGSVHGIFDTKEAAEEAKIDMGFPYPDEVLIRVLYSHTKD